MGLEYIEGRSDIAQQLHAVREHSAERELLSTTGDDDLCMSVGSKSVNTRSEPFKTDDNILESTGGFRYFQTHSSCTRL